MEAQPGAPYTLSTTVSSAFDETIADVREALSEQGFGILTEIDLAWTLKSKIGADVPAQVILGACRPQLALEAIEADPSVATLLPCNVVVRRVDGDRTVVEAFDPQAMMALDDDSALSAVTRDARERLRAALDRLPRQVPRGPAAG